jgi:hypothetical protein
MGEIRSHTSHRFPHQLRFIIHHVDVGLDFVADEHLQANMNTGEKKKEKPQTFSVQAIFQKISWENNC